MGLMMRRSPIEKVNEPNEIEEDADVDEFGTASKVVPASNEPVSTPCCIHSRSAKRGQSTCSYCVVIGFNLLVKAPTLVPYCIYHIVLLTYLFTHY